MSALKHIKIPYLEDTPEPRHQVRHTGTLSGKRSFQVLRSQGPCPFCLGESQQNHETKIVVAEPDAIQGQGKKTELFADVLMTCACDFSHRGQPSGLRGCGRSWSQEVEVV